MRYASAKSSNSTSNSALQGPSSTVSYLLNLGLENLDLIYEFSDWVLRQYPEQGLSIFTDEYSVAKKLNRDEVTFFLHFIFRFLPSQLCYFGA